MRIGNIVNTLVQLYNNETTRKRTVFLVGDSGIGKSSTVHQAVQALGKHIYDMRLSTCDPVNFGLVMPEDGRLVRQKPDFIQFMEDHPEGGILFLDEMTSAPPAVQAPAYQLTNDRQCNGFAMLDTWMVVAAGNKASNRGVTFPIAAPLLNRMTLLEVESVADDFYEYGARNNLDPRVMAFIKSREDYLHQFNDKVKPGTQFPTQRSWFAVGDKLQLNLDPRARVELIEGDVGHEAAVSFEAFLRVWETMPDINKILTKPDDVPIPDKLDVRYCVAMGLSAKLNKDNFANAWKYLRRGPKELQTLVVKLAYTRDKSIMASPAFAEWTAENSVLFSRGG